MIKNDLQNSALSKQVNIDFRLRISRRLAFITSIFMTPFMLFYLVKQEYAIALLLFFVIAFSIIKYFRSQSGKLDPFSTFVIMLLLVSLAFIIVAVNYGLIAFLWAYPILFAFYFMLPEKLAGLANILFVSIVFYFAWLIEDGNILVRIFVTLSLCSIFLASIIRIISQQHELLQKQAIIDPLTGVYNRVILEEQLEKSIQQSRRNDVSMSIATIDIDHFKVINDQFGHDKGDEVLKTFAKIITSRTRHSDNVFRIGGEEFLIYLYNTDLDQAYKFAEYLRNKVETAEIIKGHPITASIGLAQYQEGESWLEWMKRSDENLYKAKHTGRNKVVI